MSLLLQLQGHQRVYANHSILLDIGSDVDMLIIVLKVILDECCIKI